MEMQEGLLSHAADGTLGHLGKDGITELIEQRRSKSCCTICHHDITLINNTCKLFQDLLSHPRSRLVPTVIMVPSGVARLGRLLKWSTAYLKKNGT